MKRTSETRLFSSKLLGWLLVSLFALIVAHFSLQALNWLVYHQQHGQFYELANRFDFEDEVSVPTWFSQILLLSIGLCGILISYLETVKKRRIIWGLIGVGGVLLSIDEGSGLHEFVLQTLHVMFFSDASPTGQANAWLIVLPFILLLAGWFIYYMFSAIPRATLYLFILSGAVYLVGAIGVDLITSVVERESFLNQGVLVGIEETLELLGTILFLYATVRYTELTHGTAIKRAVRELKIS